MDQKLSLTEVTHHSRDIKNYRDMVNRIKIFRKQLDYIYLNEGIKPRKILREINRIKKLKKLYLNYLINNNSKIIIIKKELNQWLTIQKHWQKITTREFYKPRSELNEVESTMLNQLEEKSIKARKQQIMWRLKQEFNIAIHRQWYVIFNTLTVATEHYKTVWNPDNKIFTKYIYQFDKISGKENHRYFAVVEEGSANNREHIHIIHMLKNIPEDWKTDPNRSCTIPYRRIINSIRPLWEYGFSSPIAVRFNSADAFSRLGWLWPVKGGEPISSGNGDRLANYVSKYLTKTLEGVSSKWKLRMSQKLGLQIITKTMQNLLPSDLKQLLLIQKIKVLKIQENPIPSQLIKTSIHRQIVFQYTKESNYIPLITLKAQPSIMKRLQTLTQPTSPYSSPNITWLNQTILNNSVISKTQDLLDQYSIEFLGTKEQLPNTFSSTASSRSR